MEQKDNSEQQVSRRRFIESVATAGAGLVVAQAAVGAVAKKPAIKKPAPARKPTHAATTPAPKPKEQEVRIGIIGPGNEGRDLLVQCLLIPGIRFVAVCDIWPYSQHYAAGILRAYGQHVNVYTDYQDMLDKEQSMDAVIIATPDWMHSEITVACLKSGKHVYCEKEMSNTVEGARQMVLAQRQTGKLLQIGHQRRSNPRYEHVFNLITKDKTCGRMTHTYGQWNRNTPLVLGWPKTQELDQATLTRYGYDTMERFRNWRWYRKFSGGPLGDLGSHQIDIFNWFLQTNPSAVLGFGGHDYPNTGREWFDNAMTIYEYKTPTGQVTSFYEVLNSTSYGGYYEVFEGLSGSIQISEDIHIGMIYPEPTVAQKNWVDDSKMIQSMGKEAILLKVGETLGASGGKKTEGRKLAASAGADPHLLHLENFFSAIRHGTPLSCPADVAYATSVTILKANDAIDAGKTLQFTPDEFIV